MVQQEESSGVVRVQLIVKHQQGNCQEVIKRVTKAHEVVEVDGFVFRRKRRSSAAPATPQRQEDEQRNSIGLANAPAASPKAIELGLRLSQEADDAVTNSPLTGLDSALKPADVLARSSAMLGNTGDSTAGELALGQQPGPAAVLSQPRRALPTDTVFNIMPMELVYLVQWVLTAELKRRGHLSSDDVAAAASRATECFAKRLREFQAQAQKATITGLNAADGVQPAVGIGMGGTGIGLGAVAALPYQVERLRAALQEKHHKLVQEEAAWLQLEQRYQAFVQAQIPGESLEAAGPHGMQDEAPAPEALNGNEHMVLLQPAQEDAEGTGGSAKALMGLTSDGADVERPGAAVEGSTQVPAVPCSATASRREALQHMGLQVEALCALVAKTEAIVADAEAAASALQAVYHRDRFKAYPHIDSPAWLIRKILRPPTDGEKESSP